MSVSRSWLPKLDIVMPQASIPLFPAFRPGPSTTADTQYNTTDDHTAGHSRTSARLSNPRQFILLFSSSSPLARFAAGSAFKSTFYTQAFHDYTQLGVRARRSYAKSRKKMPPKKEVKQEKILLGRPGNSLKSGIVRRANMCVLCACPLTITNTSIGGTRQRRQIDLLPSSHKMLARQPSKLSLCDHRPRRSSCHRA